MINQVLSSVLFVLSISACKKTEDSGLHRNPDGTYSVPNSALTDEARQLINGGFTYQLPVGWSLKTVPGVPYKMAFGRESDGNPANISFQNFAFDGNLARLQTKILKETSASLSATGFTDFKVINTSMFETNSKLVGLQTVTQAQRFDGKIIRQLFYFFERKDGQKIGVVCSVADEGTTYDERFDAIMKTFRVTK